MTGAVIDQFARWRSEIVAELDKLREELIAAREELALVERDASAVRDRQSAVEATVRLIVNRGAPAASISSRVQPLRDDLRRATGLIAKATEKIGNLTWEIQDRERALTQLDQIHPQASPPGEEEPDNIRRLRA